MTLTAVSISIATFILSYSLVRPAGTLCAILIRRHWPDASFSGLITWYAVFLAVALSLVIAIVVARKAALWTRKP
jgi:hypothetical protein